MKQSFLILILAIGFGQFVSAQADRDFSFGLRAGVLFGGPIPNESNPDSTDGQPGIGPSLALVFGYQLTPRLRLTAELGYSFKAVEYARLFRKDTLVEIELLPGITDTVPSFYFADVAGKMSLHYLEIPLLLDYQIKNRWRVKGGINSSFLLGGKDLGSATIQIGQGGVFEDTTVVFDNINDIKRIDFGFVLGGSYEFESGWWIEARGYRSIRDLYQKGFLAGQGLGDTRLYQTQGYLSLGYWF